MKRALVGFGKKKRFHSSQEGLFSIPNKEAKVIVSKKLNYCEVMG